MRAKKIINLAERAAAVSSSTVNIFKDMGIDNLQQIVKESPREVEQKAMLKK